jgi:hypothetical protein
MKIRNLLITRTQVAFGQCASQRVDCRRVRVVRVLPGLRCPGGRSGPQRSYCRWPALPCRTMTDNWATALGLAAALLNRSRIPWMLVGSAATALRGVVIEPNDLDIAVNSAQDVVLAAKLMTSPGLEKSQDPEAAWFSTASAPTLSFGSPGEQWTFGRCLIDDFRLEIAYIDSPGTAALYLETRSPLSWNDREFLLCRDHAVPTVPIEPQLATMIARRQADRIEATLEAIDLGSVDRSRLLRALEDKRLEVPDLSIPAEIQALLTA